MSEEYACYDCHNLIKSDEEYFKTDLIIICRSCLEKYDEYDLLGMVIEDSPIPSGGIRRS